MKKISFAIILLLFGTASGFAQTPVSIIPIPRLLQTGTGSFELNKARLVIPAEAKAKRVALFFAEAIRQQTGINLLTSKGVNTISFVYNSSITHPEGYEINITSKKIVVEANADKGLFWAVQSLRQLLPIEKNGSVNLPVLLIKDEPRYTLRSNMLDVSRHFFSVDFIKKHLDLLSLYKINTFHWHLTDDQGWRVEIKKYPALTAKGAWRTEPDGTRYGGFYTQDEIKELVHYAGQLHISVIPEIEMPGHAVAALVAYPELSCSKKQLAVPFYFGVHRDVFCAGQEKTYTFLQDILNEVMPLFPSQYVHIGGDEVPKDRWHECPVCQQKIKQQGLKDEHGLQSYFVKRMQKFLQSKGKKMIGWDEILEGGADKNAVIEVWRGHEKAKEAIANGNKIIQTVYFDGPPASLTLQKTFEHNPAVAGVEGQVLGSDSPVWTEYITELNGEYMIYPRMQAFAEALWSGGTNFDDFKNRLQYHYRLMESKGVMYGAEDKNLLSAHLKYIPQEKQWRLYAQTGLNTIKTHYTFGYQLPGPESPSFHDSITITSPSKINLTPFRGNTQALAPLTFNMINHLALGKKVIFNTPYSENYKQAGDFGLSDGIIGSLNYADGNWLGWSGKNLDVTIEMDSSVSFNSLQLTCLQQTNSWIQLPRKVDFYSSDDGKEWIMLSSQTHQVPDDDFKPQVHAFSFWSDKPLKAKFIKVVATGYGKLPAWHSGAGSDAWIFADEIIVK